MSLLPYPEGSETACYSIEEGEYGISATSKLFNGTTEKISGPINDIGRDFVNQGNSAR